MNDEIKEILEQLEWYRKIGKKDVYYPEYVLPNKKAFILLDYITNLQRDNEMYAQLKDEYEEEIKELQQEIERQSKAQVILDDMLADYNYRINKAIEYIKNCEIVDKDKKYPLLEEQFGEDLLNILQNGSDSIDKD